ncbi:2-dehydropantoate 2-reductase [Alkalihalobacillus sp. BA299]|uniref:2-dehydropantoate 2-reductase n=1 Tax=Alkalihalobacillus sp. BA299 TaxID=2815938 RepID=UPI001ADCD6BE|nr:2-dehydropantoate 2-reductase [Alkalihalobacillus sp. BA299]
MRVGVIGGGAIGLLLSAYLRKSGFIVTIYTRKKLQAVQLEEHGITLKRNNEVHNIHVHAKPLDEVVFLDDELVFVTVKQFHIKEVCNTIQRHIKYPKAVIFLQNGMGHLDKIKKLPIETIIIGIVEHGAMRFSMTEVHHTGIGTIKIGAIKGKIINWTSIWQALTEHHFPIVVTNDWLMIMMRKLVVNSCINPLTALYRVTNGVLISNPHFLKLMRLVYEETVESINLENREEVWGEVVMICEKTAQNRSSMLRDVENRNETEIEAILGYVLQKAEEKRLPMPVTTFLYESIKGIEQEEREKVE